MRQRHSSRKKGRIPTRNGGETNRKKNPLLNSQITGYDSEKPREETEYQAFYPDLDIKEPLSVYIVKSLDADFEESGSQQPQKQPLPETLPGDIKKRIELSNGNLTQNEKRQLMKAIMPKPPLQLFIKELLQFSDESEVSSHSKVPTKTKAELYASFRKIATPKSNKRGLEDSDEADTYTIYNKKKKFFNYIEEEKQRQENTQLKETNGVPRQCPDLSSSTPSSRTLESVSSTPNSSIDFQNPLMGKVLGSSLLSSGGIRDENCVNRNCGHQQLVNNNPPTESAIRHPYFTPQIIPRPSLDLILERNPNLIYQQSRIITETYFKKIKKASFDISSNANLLNSYLSNANFKLPNNESFEELRKENQITKSCELSENNDDDAVGGIEPSCKLLSTLNPNIQKSEFKNKIRYFGFKKLQEYELSRTYIRENDYVNTESFELDVFEEFAISHKLDIKGFSMFRCMYDMDEQDDYLLGIINKKRVKNKQVFIPPEIFEICISFLEKEWYFLSKRIPRNIDGENELALKYEKAKEFANLFGSDDGIGMAPENDQPCAVCNDSDCDNQNAIVFCDGCNIAVHQECYGVVFIPEGQWLCRRCMNLKRRKILCEFCPSLTGAFKQTDSGSWSHLLCGLWIPELGLKSNIYMETIDGIEKIPKSRWKLVCYICKQKMGACIQCANKNCFQAFHVTCAKRAGLYLKMHGGIQGVLHDKMNLTAFCDKHLPNDYHHSTQVKEGIDKTRSYFSMLNHHENDGPKYKTFGDGISYFEHANMMRKKSSRTVVSAVKALKDNNHKILRWQSRKGTPIAPQLFLDKLMKLLIFLKVEDGAVDKLAQTICKYWALKREWKTSPLIKTLDVYNLSSVESSSEAIKKIKMGNVMNNDIHKLIDISEDIITRQKLLLEGYTKDIENIEKISFPVCGLIKPILAKVIRLDSEDLLRQYEPSVVKDGKVVKNVDILSLDRIVDKLGKSGYTKCVAEFNNDLKLLFKNVEQSQEKRESVKALQQILRHQFIDQVYPELDRVKKLEYEIFEKNRGKGGYESVLNDLELDDVAKD